MTFKGFKNVSLKESLIKDVEEILKMGRYNSVAEFVAEAVRLRLEHLEKLAEPKGKEHGR